MSFAWRVLQALEGVNRGLFRLAAWACIAMALLGCAIVLARYGFSWGSIATQELLMYLHGFVLLAASATTLALDEHVRVDIFYRSWSPRRQAMVDIAGYLLLGLPVMLFVWWVSYDYVAHSWAQREASSEAGGLPGVYLLKGLILLFALQMALQMLLQIGRAAQRWQSPDESHA